MHEDSDKEMRVAFVGSEDAEDNAIIILKHCFREVLRGFMRWTF